MNQLTCEICGSTDLIKQNGAFTCQVCGCKYSVEEVRKMVLGDPVPATEKAGSGSDNRAGNETRSEARPEIQNRTDNEADNGSIIRSRCYKCGFVFDRPMEFCTNCGARTLSLISGRSFVEDHNAGDKNCSSTLRIEIPASARVSGIIKNIGDKVTVGERVIIVEAEEQEIPVCSTLNGSITAIHVKVGQELRQETGVVTIMNNNLKSVRLFVAPK